MKKIVLILTLFAAFFTVCNLSAKTADLGFRTGKVLAAAAIDLLCDPALLKEAKAEFQKRTAEGYTCPTPKDAIPVIPD